MKPKVIAVMPAYNAEKTVQRTVADIPPGSVDEIILVDDCSKDNTVAVAKRLGLKVIQHTKRTKAMGEIKRPAIKRLWMPARTSSS